MAECGDNASIHETNSCEKLIIGFRTWADRLNSWVHAVSGRSDEFRGLFLQGFVSAGVCFCQIPSLPVPRLSVSRFPALTPNFDAMHSNLRISCLIFLSLHTLIHIGDAQETEAEQPPNIVFFFTDDQTTSTLGCYGNPVVQTPNIDALAREGTRFDNACVSHSICWVSRTTILSGLTGRSFGTHHG